MYLSYYKLNKNPFEISTDPSFLWLGEKHKEALSILKYGVTNDKGFLLLTGDVGTGKTTLINAFINILGNDVIAARVSDPGLTKLEFMKYVAQMFKIDTDFERKSEFLLLFTQFLEQAESDNKKVILIIDEAQQLSDETLEEIRLLSNIERQDRKLFTILLVGQNEFNETLGKYKNRALRQRLTISYTLTPFNAEETRACVEYRLAVAGVKKEIFTPAAIDAIHSISMGFPRVINIICDHALLLGYVEEQEIISEEMIGRCSKELHPAHFPASHEKNSFFNTNNEWLEESEIPPLSIEAIERASKPLPDPEIMPRPETKRRNLLSRAIVPIFAVALVFAAFLVFKGDTFNSIIQIFTQKISETIAAPLQKGQTVAVSHPDRTSSEPQENTGPAESTETTTLSPEKQTAGQQEAKVQETNKVDLVDRKVPKIQTAPPPQKPSGIRTPQAPQLTGKTATPEVMVEKTPAPGKEQVEALATPTSPAIISGQQNSSVTNSIEMTIEVPKDVQEKTPAEVEISQKDGQELMTQAQKDPEKLQDVSQQSQPVTPQPPSMPDLAAAIATNTGTQESQGEVAKPAQETSQVIEPQTATDDVIAEAEKTAAPPKKVKPGGNEDPGAIIDWLLKAKQNQ
ncbi:AAA family ATPase [Desulforhopalus sp. IMCC35007]|uniref:AAA family ATPase n=1 Tax=Desulforhopalus sp. IMCC35007 TaxID=2569543 RepID=UPI00145F49FE|nr:AAA family ATPase [Desulforhopalus sp. IMCC35007]